MANKRPIDQEEFQRQREASRWILGRWQGPFVDSEHFLTPVSAVDDGNGKAVSVIVVRFPTADSVAETVRKTMGGSQDSGQLFLVGFPPLGWHSTPHLLRTLAVLPADAGVLDAVDNGNWFAVQIDRSQSRRGVRLVFQEMAGQIEDMRDRFENRLEEQKAEHQIAIDDLAAEVVRVQNHLDQATTVISDLRHHVDLERWERSKMKDRRWWRLGMAVRGLLTRSNSLGESLGKLRQSFTRLPQPDPPTKREFLAAEIFRDGVSTQNDPGTSGAGFVDEEPIPVELEAANEYLESSESAQNFIEKLEHLLDGKDPKATRQILRRASSVASNSGWLDERVSLTEELWRHPYDDADRLEHIAALLAVQNLHDASHLIAKLEDRNSATARGRRVIEDVANYSRLVDELAWADPARPPDFEPQESKVVAFLHNSLPYSNGGYATRAHGLLSAVADEGFDVVAYTRPGYPKDFVVNFEDFHLPSEDRIDGLLYRRLFEEFDRGTPESEYILRTASAYERTLRDEAPQIVHGRSTYLSSLPALIAARRCGLPFIYEVSGLWEIVHASRDSASRRSAEIRWITFLETLVATHADHVFTLNHAMEDELAERGVDRNRLTVVPNSVDPTRFQIVERSERLAVDLDLPLGVPVVGYVGSFQDYEGLDDLIQALAMVSRQGLDFRALLVGSGAMHANIAEAIREADLTEEVRLLGRVPFEEVPEYYSLIDIACFPRKPNLLTEIVSPMKPLEAMALGKCVVVSSVLPLQELVDHEETGLVFEKGNPESLTRELARAIQEQDLRSRMGKSASASVRSARTWKHAAGKVTAGYERVLKTKARQG